MSEIELDEAGMPVHLAMGVNAKGQGPVGPSEEEFVGWLCWCGDRTCEKHLRPAFDPPVERGSPWQYGFECEAGPHRGPQGPNEDVDQCSQCFGISWIRRSVGLHIPDCSLPIDHESYCKPGGSGHPQAKTIRG